MEKKMDDTIKDKITREVTQGFDKVTTTISQTVGGTFRDVVGPEINKLFDFVKDMASGVWSWVKAAGTSVLGIFTGFGKSEELQEQEKQTGILNNIWGYFKREERRQSRAMPEDDKGNLTIIGLLGALLGMVAGSLAALTGGILASFLIPFRVLTDFGVALGRLVGRLVPTTKLFTRVGAVLGKILGPLRTVLNFFTKIGSATTGLLKSMSPFVRSFGRMLRFIPVIGWGITLIMGIVDFFRGFRQSEGEGILERIKDGLVSVIMGFFDPVFKVFGWLADKVLGWFNIEIDGGSAEAIMKFFRGSLEGFYNGIIWLIEGIGKLFWGTVNFIQDKWHYVKSIWDFGVSAIKRDWQLMGEHFQSVIQWLKDTVQGVFDAIGHPFDKYIRQPLRKLVEWFTGTPDHSKWDKILDTIYEIVQKVFDFIMKPFEMFILNPIEKLIGWIGSLKDTRIGAAVEGLIGRFSRKKSKSKEEEDAELDKAISGAEDDGLFKELVEINRELLEIERYKMSLIKGQQEALTAEERAHQEKMYTDMRKNAIPLPTDKQTNVVSNQNVMTSGGGGRSNEREAPDEVEHIGMLLMTNSTLAPAM
jgi:hypothetical protein